MPPFQAFELNELEKRHADHDGPYLEFLRRRGMSMGLYQIGSGGEDHQHPHGADEVYVVLHGKGTLRTEGGDHAVQAGSVISVDHGAEHRFVDVTEDLELLVVFAPPESPED
jgi:quercetin dioxygenase-like cupin family protein